MVTPAYPTVPFRLQILLWFLGFLSFGLLSLWLGLIGVVPTARAIAARAPIVSFRPRDVIPLPLALPGFALAVNALIMGATYRADGRPSNPGGRSAKWIIAIAGIGLMGGAALSIVAAPIAELAVANVLAHRGYRHCPAPLVLAHPPPMRWARPDAFARCFQP